MIFIQHRESVEQSLHEWNKNVKEYMHLGKLILSILYSHIKNPLSIWKLRKKCEENIEIVQVAEEKYSYSYCKQEFLCRQNLQTPLSLIQCLFF